jgi:transposase-like protein
MRLKDVFNTFKTQEDCIAFLEARRWNGKPICPYCKSDVTHAHFKRHQCNKCHKSFSVTVGTIFHRTHVELQQWFALIVLMMNAKKGLSSLQASRDLGMRPATVWSMMHRIRNAFKQHNTDLFAGIVEMDETYIKTDEDNDDNSQTPKRGRGANKTSIIVIKERKCES